VALSRGSPRVGVTDHPVLWSPDLPHRAGARRDRPADSPVFRIRRTPPGRGERQACGQAGEREDGKQVPVVEVGDRDREHEQDDRGDPGQHAAGPTGTREPDQA
jgi:hypothetical protein